MYFSRRTARCNKALTCLARNYATHWHTRPEKNKMIWFRPSVGETCPCTSLQHGATETVSTNLNAFVCSAVVGRVCRCKISAKYGRSVTSALEVTFLQFLWTKATIRHEGAILWTETLRCVWYVTGGTLRPIRHPLTQIWLLHKLHVFIVRCFALWCEPSRCSRAVNVNRN
jgi:hypothetical protein